MHGRVRYARPGQLRRRRKFTRWKAPGFLQRTPLCLPRLEAATRRGGVVALLPRPKVTAERPAPSSHPEPPGAEATETRLRDPAARACRVVAQIVPLVVRPRPASAAIR